MKSKLLTIARLLNIYLVAALTLVYSSCSETELVDSTGFILQYYGVTDIGPSMTYTLEAPTYKGSTPYDFTITGVTLNEEAFENADYFVIDAETGAITIQNTESIPTGLYNISVGCYSNGKFYNFKDAVQVNMLLAVPDGVTVEPAEVLVNQDEENWAEASAQVTTEQDKHVSITGYSIVQDESKPYLAYFNIDGKGKITINPETKDKLIAGESYVLSLKLTTGAGEHMYTDAVTFKVVSKPRNLFYISQEALPDLFEVRVEGKSVVPTIEGAKDGLKFTIKSVTPETNAFTIDEATGQIMLPEGHSLEEDETPYVFTITASNNYGSTDFESIYSAKIVAFIEPIQPNTFHYTEVNNLYQLGGQIDSYEPDQGFVGGAPTFSFDESNYEDNELKTHIDQEIITINSANGAISIANTHTLSAKTHEIKVRVTNKKNEEGTVATLSVTVVKNPNDFTKVSWGTNIEHDIVVTTKGGEAIKVTSEQESSPRYMNQYRFIHNRDILPTITLQYINKETESSTIQYDLAETFPAGKFKDTTVDPNTGTITLGDTPLANSNTSGTDYEGGILLIKVTSSGNGAPSVSKNIPVFISASKAESNKTLIFQPFVIKVNPKTGVASTIDSWKELHIQSTGGHNYVTQEPVTTNITFDYTGNYKYYNFDNNQKHASGTLGDTDPSKFLYQVWHNCGFTKDSEKGNITPLTYYLTGNKAAYINSNCELTIFSDKWKGVDGKYPYGAIVGQMKYNTDTSKGYEDIHSSSSTSKAMYSLIIWFDENFE